MSKAWMPLYIGDYLGDTTHLTQGQHGAYLLMIMHYWVRGSIPADKKQCYSIAHAMDMQSRSNADAVLKHFFTLQDGCYRHARIDKELKIATESYERRANAAKSRWSKEKKNGSIAYALHMQSQSHINTNTPLTPLSGGNGTNPLTTRERAKIEKFLQEIARAMQGSDYDPRHALERACLKAGIEFERAKEMLP